jgi:hypothetical protein
VTLAPACSRSRIVTYADGPGISLPAVASVRCDADGTKVLTPTVRTQPNGVHIRVDNRSGVAVGLEIDRFGADNARSGISELVFQVPPGHRDLRCLGRVHVGEDRSGFEPLTVVDPDRLWVSTDCVPLPGGGAATANKDYLPGTTGDQGDPVDIFRHRYAARLRSGDVVERAGYAQAPRPWVRVVRDGRTIATSTYSSDGHGGWLEDTTTTCGDF